MAFKATLKMLSKEFDVISMSYAFNRDVDVKGRPASRVYGGNINLTVESTEDTSIIESMLNSKHKPFNGTITFFKDDEDAKLKELAFENSYIISFNESFSTGHTDPTYCSFIITAEIFKMGSAEHDSEWPKA
jgi:hypothetical protein